MQVEDKFFRYSFQIGIYPNFLIYLDYYSHQFRKYYDFVLHEYFETFVHVGLLADVLVVDYSIQHFDYIYHRMRFS